MPAPRGALPCYAYTHPNSAPYQLQIMSPGLCNAIHLPDHPVLACGVSAFNSRQYLAEKQQQLEVVGFAVAPAPVV